MDFLKAGIKFLLSFFLAIFYVLYVLPASFFTRSGRRDFLKERRGGGSYFKDRNHTFKPVDFEKM